MTAAYQKPFARRFIRKMRDHFDHGLASCKADKTGHDSVDKWGEKSAAYFKHAVAACDYMLNKLDTYREAPIETDRTNPNKR